MRKDMAYIVTKHEVFQIIRSSARLAFSCKFSTYVNAGMRARHMSGKARAIETRVIYRQAPEIALISPPPPLPVSAPSRRGIATKRDIFHVYAQSTILNPRLCVLATAAAGPPRLESDISHSYPFKQNVKVPDDNARKINQAC